MYLFIYFIYWFYWFIIYDNFFHLITCVSCFCGGVNLVFSVDFIWRGNYVFFIVLFFTVFNFKNVLVIFLDYFIVFLIIFTVFNSLRVDRCFSLISINGYVWSANLHYPDDELQLVVRNASVPKIHYVILRKIYN